MNPKSLGVRARHFGVRHTQYLKSVLEERTHGEVHLVGGCVNHPMKYHEVIHLSERSCVAQRWRGWLKAEDRFQKHQKRKERKQFLDDY